MGQAKGYKRIGRFSLEEVLPYIGKGNHSFWIPDQNKRLRVGHLSNQRMMLIARTQCCVVCQFQGSHFWLEHSGCFSPHFNLYATNHQGHETLMTMDHILPRSKGGPTSQENIQLMCRKCNKVKKNYLISNEDVLRLRFRSDPILFEHVKEAYMLINPEYIPTLEELFANRKKPVIQQELSCFTTSISSLSLSLCSSLPVNEASDSPDTQSGFVESSTSLT
jgi:5-methylcytosine-specific restriction endonuclease McrA